MAQVVQRVGERMKDEEKDERVVDTTRFSPDRSGWSVNFDLHQSHSMIDETPPASAEWSINFGLQETFTRKQETPPALAAWSINFDLHQSHSMIDETPRFSGVESQFQPTTCICFSFSPGFSLGLASI
jgi:hypothetical protein